MKGKIVVNNTKNPDAPIYLDNFRQVKKLENQNNDKRGIMAFIEEKGKDNDKIMEATMKLADPLTDKIFIFLPLEISLTFEYYLRAQPKSIREEFLEKRKQNARMILFKYQQLLEEKNFIWATLLIPTLKANRKIKEIVEAFQIKQVIFPNSKKSLKNWTAKKCSEDCTAKLLRELATESVEYFSEPNGKNSTPRGKETKKPDKKKRISFWQKLSKQTSASYISFDD